MKELKYTLIADGSSNKTLLRIIKWSLAETTNVKIIDQRLNEIVKEIGEDEFRKTICIVPIKMMEAWLLIDVEAIKKAAGNRNYSGSINLPSINNQEKENQPKNILHDLLKEASGLKSRNLKKFNPDKAVHLVAENIEDFSPLWNLIAFQSFERNLIEVVNNHYINFN